MRISEYRKYWRQKSDRDKIAAERLRREALKTAGKLGRDLAREFHVKKVVLFGSVLKEGEFREDSDIDLAVEGLEKKKFFKAAAMLMMKSDIPVDLKPVEDVTEALKKRIAKGIILYEKRADS